MAETYKVTICKAIDEVVSEFKDATEARLYGAQLRKHHAEKMGVDIFDIWFETEKIEDDDE